MLIKIKEDVKKQFDVGFLAVAKYPIWVANIVPVPKDGKVRMCINYRDLNRASSKDNFSLPYIDVLVDNTTGFSTFSFMDGFSGYNQIKMALEDQEKMTFITLWGTFCYKVMPFGLKNAGATYQKAMVTLFHDLMHKEIEVYVDDMITKSRLEEKHVVTLCCQKAFDKIKDYLQSPPILVPPTLGRPLILYLIVKEGSMGCVLGQHDSTGKKEQVVYYLKFDIVYITRKAIKGSVIANCLAELPIEDYESMKFDFPDEDIMALVNTSSNTWTMKFDGATNEIGHGVGAILMSHDGKWYPLTAKLYFDCTNNMAEYEACSMGVRMAYEMKVKTLRVLGDSLLFVHQLNEEWETRNAKLIPYNDYIRTIAQTFDSITFEHVPHESNQVADALATLSAMFNVAYSEEVQPIRMEKYKRSSYCMSLE
ncbi:Transposon Ty3-I Gag-Pol polyprotein [Cucumis melo var. makuwa]|uniref:Transposon Ty3-I Gag-Pol polyprotein n=1 Tax=Cucumis melo var. makuwa TaxID=1194695 RepID=A0A5D3C389_CUCMM|nr:Transposon Ty3-I Gag-Pol polyprotein [Cucumis melo var. makuwa]